MDAFEAFILGLVQGLTEFLPISSSGHLTLVPWLFNWDSPGLAFDASLHLGTLVAVIVYFRAEITRMILAIPFAIRNLPGLIRGKEFAEKQSEDARLGVLIAIGCVPGAVFGLLGENRIEEFFHSVEHEDRAMIVIAILAGWFWSADAFGGACFEAQPVDDGPTAHRCGDSWTFAGNCTSARDFAIRGDIDRGSLSEHQSGRRCTFLVSAWIAAGSRRGTKRTE